MNNPFIFRLKKNVKLNISNNVGDNIVNIVSVNLTHNVWIPTRGTIKIIVFNDIVIKKVHISIQSSALTSLKSL